MQHWEQWISLVMLLIDCSLCMFCSRIIPGIADNVFSISLPHCIVVSAAFTLLYPLTMPSHACGIVKHIQETVYFCPQLFLQGMLQHFGGSSGMFSDTFSSLGGISCSNGKVCVVMWRDTMIRSEGYLAVTWRACSDVEEYL